MIDKVKVKFKRLHPDAKLPKYARYGDAGADVYSVEEVVLLPGEIKLISLGFSMEIPYGYEMQARTRSGMATKGLIILNSPATLDAGWRGENKCILMNVGKESYKVNKLDRVAQFVLKQVPQAEYEEVEELTPSERADGGFGSSGTK